MRDYVTKVENGGTTSAGQLSAEEFNELAQELENVVTRSGQTLNQAVLTQVAQSAFLNAVKAQAFQAGGTVDALELTPISGATGVVLPADYTALGGAEVSFLSIGTNTGAVTVNIGQTGGGLLGSKSLVDVAGAALTAGAVPTSGIVRILFDATNDRWVLLNPATSAQTFEDIVPLTSFTTTQSSIDVGWDTSVYTTVEFEFFNVLPIDGSDGFLYFQFSDDDASTFINANLHEFYSIGGNSNSPSADPEADATIDRAPVSTSLAVENQTGNANASGASGKFTVMRPSKNERTAWLADVVYDNTIARISATRTGGILLQSNVVNGLRMGMATLAGSTPLTVVNMKEGEYRVRGFF